MLLILSLLLLGLGVFLCIMQKLRSNEDSFRGITAVVLGLMLSIIFTLIMLVNYNHLRKLEAFYESNSRNYAITTTKTETLLSQQKAIGGLLIEGSIEKINLAVAASERIKEWRDAVVMYNTKLKEFRYWDENIWIGLLYPTPSDELKMLIIGE